MAQLLNDTHETMSIDDLDQRFCTRQENILNSIKDDSIHITGLCLYPVKGCRGMSVRSWPITEYGMYLDRHWCIYSTTTKRFLNIEYALDSLMIHAYIDIDNKLLILASHNMVTNFVIKILDEEFQSLNDENLISFIMCGKRTSNIFEDCGDKVADWINEALQRDDCRLMRQTQLREGKLGLIRGQLLIISANSIHHLTELVAEDIGYCSAEPYDLCWRFRGNIIISGLNPYDEHRWKKISIKKLNLEYNDLCERCKAVNADPERLDYEKYPLKYLQRAGQGRPDFGIFMTICNPDSEKELCVGDEIVVHE